MLLSFFACLMLSPENSIPAWTLKESGVNTSIRGLSAVDARICWFGTKGGVARTVDGGKAWQVTRIGGEEEELDFRDLHAFSDRRCLAMSAGEGRASRLYLTEDGGNKWELVFQNEEPGGFFNGIAFVDEKRGFLAGDPVEGRLYLLATRDGGATWERLAAGTAPRMDNGEHAFAASGTHLATNRKGHIWVGSGGQKARVFLSEDEGRQWKIIDTPMIAGKPSTGIFSLAFLGQDGIAVGGDYERESEGARNLMLTRDGAKTWQLVTKQDGSSPFPFRSCAGYLDAKTIVAVGPAGTNISPDGGKNWQALRGSPGFHTLSIGDGRVWAAGADGRVGILDLREWSN